jgi:hypothetical protein
MEHHLENASNTELCFTSGFRSQMPGGSTTRCSSYLRFVFGIKFLTDPSLYLVFIRLFLSLI